MSQDEAAGEMKIVRMWLVGCNMHTYADAPDMCMRQLECLRGEIGAETVVQKLQGIMDLSATERVRW